MALAGSGGVRLRVLLDHVGERGPVRVYVCPWWRSGSLRSTRTAHSAIAVRRVVCRADDGQVSRISLVPDRLKAWTSPVCRCCETTLPGSRRISSDHPPGSDRSGRNDLPSPVGIQAISLVWRGKARSRVQALLGLLGRAGVLGVHVDVCASKSSRTGICCAAVAGGAVLSRRHETWCFALIGLHGPGFPRSSSPYPPGVPGGW